MGESMDKLIKAIKHYQESLERHTKTGNSEKLLHAIEKLNRLPIKVCHLEETGVGRTVNGLKRFEGPVGENARTLVDKWKTMVKGEEDEEQARREQQKAENEVVDEEPDPESLQIVDQEENNDNDVYTNNSSHRKSSSSNKHSHNNSNRSSNHDQTKDRDKYDRNSKRSHSSHGSDNNSDSSSDSKSKKYKSIKSEKNSGHKQHSASDSESEESDSSRDSSPRRSKDKTKSSRRSSSESSDESSDDSEHSSSDDSSSSDRESKSNRKQKKSHSSTSESDGDKSIEHKLKESSSKHKKSSSESDRDYKYNKSKSKDQYDSHSSKSKDSHNKSKDKSDKRDKDRETSSSSGSKSKSKHTETESKHKKETEKEKSRRKDEEFKKSEDKKKDARKESSKSHKEKENNKTSQDKKRSRETSSERVSKRPKADSSNNKSSKNKTSEHYSSSSKREKESSEKKRDTSDNKKEKNRSEAEKNKKSTSSKEKDKPKTSNSSKSGRSATQLINGIDSGSGTSFADVLGMLEVPTYGKNKKKSTGIEEKTNFDKSTSSTKEGKLPRSRSSAEESISVQDIDEVPNLLKDPGQLEPLDINISSLLPSITPNYRPLSAPLDGANRKMWTDDEALTRVISAKHQRTKVYSGNKCVYTKVPTLFEICSRILQDNLDALEYTGGVPYSILKHILEKANPDQLYQLEFHNPYLIEDTDELWQLHCQKEFRNKKREEMESWREMYMRCLDEREAKLKALTANIKQSQDKSLPVRQTKLAYVDSVVKPPRNIARKQAKNGTAVDIKRPSQTPTERLNQLAKSGEAAKVAVPNPGRAAADRSTSSSSSSHSSNLKPKKAPLMAKTLSLLKNRFGRR